MNDYINDENNGSNDNRGKFSDRIKNIRKERLKRKKHTSVEVEEENVFKKTGRNILKVILVVPSVIYTHVNSDKKKNGEDKKKEIFALNKKNELTSDKKVDDLRDYQQNNERKIKVNKIRDIDVSLLRKKKELYLKDLEKSGIYLDKEVQNVVDAQIKIAILQKEIIDLIKKRLVKSVNELEVLQSELYILKEVDGNSVYFDKCKENIREIKKLLSKVKSLKEKYDYLKETVDFDYMLEYGDDFLIDKILELKEICSRDDIKYIVDNYKILDEYKYLYLKIDKLHEDTIKLEEERDKRVEDLRQRDIDFDKMKNDVYDVDREKDRYDNFVREQELFLKKLGEKVNQIDSHERVTYRLKGFNQLVGNSFKYLGLLLVNPLKGLIPGIATQTMVTRNMIHNLYNNLEWQEDRKMIYEAIDYSLSIKAAIDNLDDTSILVNSTLEDVMRLKMKYMSEFSKYEKEIPGYRDTIRKINKIENAMLGSKIKIELMKQKMK